MCFQGCTDTMHVQGKKCKHALFLPLLPCTLISMYLSSLVACDVPKSCALLQAHLDTLLAALNWQENIDNTNGICHQCKLKPLVL